ncbi:hypothetical protein [Microbulbifer sp. DLAB2-AA]|uniref:hypothetical protein n=1 Tax=Microbulbifer sp. DLAB2-AA TaxID=3243394 RepID=UPI00403A49C9
MGLIWDMSHSISAFEAVEGDNTEYKIYNAESQALSSEGIYQDLAESLELAISKLSKNVNDSSRYFFIQWEPISSQLTLTVTDDQRKNDAQAVVRCHFTALEKQFQESQFKTDDDKQSAIAAFSEDLHFWCKEFLSTDQGFSQFSLVALFTSGSRDSAVIL